MEHDKIKVGDKVMWKGSWGADHPASVVVTRIEIDCESGHGQEVDDLDWKALPTSDGVDGRSVVLELDNGHWAYSFQITQQPDDQDEPECSLAAAVVGLSPVALLGLYITWALFWR